MPNFTPLINGDPANAAHFNAPLNELSVAIDTLRKSARHFGGRLTAQSNQPVPYSVLGASTLYLKEFHSRVVEVYKASLGRWVEREIPSGQISTSLAGKVGSATYDVFVYDDDGQLVLEMVQWSTATTRNAGVAPVGYFEGVLVNTLNPDKRLCGAVVIDGGGGTVTDSTFLRGVRNIYNQLPRPVRIIGTTPHTHPSSWTWRAWNNDSGLRAYWVSDGLFTDVIQWECVSRIDGIVGSSPVQVGLCLNNNNGESLDSDVIQVAAGTIATHVTHGHIVSPAGLNYMQITELVAGATSPTFASTKATGYIMS